MSGELDKILISSSLPDFKKSLEKLHHKLLAEARFGGFDVESEDNRQTVLNIVRDVNKRGDKAVAEYTEKFDDVKLKPQEFRIPEEDLKKAHKEIDATLLKSLRQAIENVREYQTEIFIGNKNTHPGIRYTPIKRVGLCVPGASAPLPSTVIMTAVPAQVAGVKEIAVVSPPRYKGSIHPVILAVCYELGIKEVYRIGGAQAVAALGCGTEKIHKVDKIVGPGNKWVQTAKLIVFGYVGIDSVAGPSEVLIIASDNANPAWVAADMLSQAEHDPGSAVVFTDSKQLAEKIVEQLSSQVKQLDREKQTIKCLKEYSKIAVFNNMNEVISAANYFAAEHLEIQCGSESRKIADKIENAGAIFIGDYTPVAVGDYWAGPSHTLPTGQTAKFFSALSSNDFIKSTSIIEFNKKQLTENAADIIRIAQTEGLDAHAKSIKIRR
ncbi:MAG: histidinol dehydrogenase [Planctomycetota bacterium]|nr:histidinol dehydrogenase [Planctomycetota bacterium]